MESETTRSRAHRPECAHGRGGSVTCASLDRRYARRSVLDALGRLLTSLAPDDVCLSSRSAMLSRPRWTSSTRFTTRRVLCAVVLCAILPLCLLAVASSSLPVHSWTAVPPCGWSTKDSPRQLASSAVLQGTREVVDTHGNLVFNLPGAPRRVSRAADGSWLISSLAFPARTDRLKEDEFYLFSAYSAGSCSLCLVRGSLRSNP